MIRKQLLISIILLICTSSTHFAYAHYNHSNNHDEHCHTINEDNGGADTEGADAQYENTYEQDTNGEYLSTPRQRFSINPSSPGVVIDHQTKTMWYRCIFPGKYENGACDRAGSPTINIVSGFDYTTDRSWYNAFKSALAANALASDGVSYGGYTDWRLPNLNELAFIVDRGCATKAATGDKDNAFPTNFFLQPTSGRYFINSEGETLDSSQEIWSATPKIFNEGDDRYTSYTVDFKLGTEDLQVKRKDDGTNKNVFVILMRSCKQEDEC